MPYTYAGANGKSVNNYDRRYRGFTTLREAITDSINIVTVKTLAQAGVSLGWQYVQEYGFTTVDSRDMNEALALGGITQGVSNLELTAAYAAIANQGTYIKPKFYTKILDHDGNVLIDNTTPESHTVIKDTTAWLLTSAMEDVMTSGTVLPLTLAVPWLRQENPVQRPAAEMLYLQVTHLIIPVLSGVATMIMPCRKVPIQTIQNVSGKLL